MQCNIFILTYKIFIEAYTLFVLLLFYVHFADNMWKTTYTGKKKLKSNAIPTIFFEHIESIPTAVTANRSILKKNYKMSKILLNEYRKPQVLEANSAKDVHSQNQVQNGMQMECTSSNALEREHNYEKSGKNEDIADSKEYYKRSIDNLRKIINRQAAIIKNMKIVHKKIRSNLKKKL